MGESEKEKQGNGYESKFYIDEKTIWMPDQTSMKCLDTNHGVTSKARLSRIGAVVGWKILSYFVMQKTCLYGSPNFSVSCNCNTECHRKQNGVNTNSLFLLKSSHIHFDSHNLFIEGSYVQLALNPIGLTQQDRARTASSASSNGSPS